MAQLDHIVLLLSTSDFEDPPSYLANNFTIIEGGTHTGQSSRNKLIFFKDGTYLELFNWFDDPPAPNDEKQPMRVWGQKYPGLIDFALTSTGSPEEYISELNQRLEGNELGVAYQQPVPGGRKRADGVGVKWKVSRPAFHRANRTPGRESFPGGRLDAPFFCHDVTGRNIRVLFDDENATTHPCGAVGIAEVQVMVPPIASGELSDYVPLYKKICGADRFLTDDSGGAGITVSTPAMPYLTSKITVRRPSDIAMIRERGVGISEIIIRTDAGYVGKAKQLGEHGIASTIWLV